MKVIQHQQKYKPTPTETVKPTPTETSSSYIKMDIDETEIYVGDTTAATVLINEIINFSAYQVNIKYDTEMLQAVNIETGKPFTNNTFPTGDTILVNEEYGPTKIAENEIENGIINFGNLYTYVQDYRNDGKPEESGILGKIGFKALKPGDYNTI